VPESGQKWQKVKHKKMTKKSPDPKRRLNQGNRPKTDPKRPVKQGIRKIGEHPKSATPKMMSKCPQSYIYLHETNPGGCQSERLGCMGTYP
jgi:hypothetical protein